MKGHVVRSRHASKETVEHSTWVYNPGALQGNLPGQQSEHYRDWSLVNGHLNAGFELRMGFSESIGKTSGGVGSIAKRHFINISGSAGVGGCEITTRPSGREVARDR